MKQTLNGREVFVYEFKIECENWSKEDGDNTKGLYRCLTYICKKHNIQANWQYSEYRVEGTVPGDDGLTIIKTLNTMMELKKFKIKTIEATISIY